jgi:hypothetical protein
MLNLVPDRAGCRYRIGRTEEWGDVAPEVEISGENRRYSGRVLLSQHEGTLSGSGNREELRSEWAVLGTSYKEGRKEKQKSS